MTTIDDIDTYKFMVSNWPEVVSLYHPPSAQMTLPEKAMCRSVQTFLIMNKKKIKYEERTNAEYMSPNNQLPFIIVNDHIFAGWDEITEHLIHDEANNLNDVADVYLFTRLNDLEQYTSWCADSNYDHIKSIYLKLYPFPLNRILSYRKKNEIVNKLKYKLENKTNITTVYEEIKGILEHIDSTLTLNKKDLVDRKSNKFNALLYGHLYALLNTELFSDELKDIVKSCKNLLEFYNEIENRFYKSN